MNYIQQAYRGKHEWWRYFVGTIGIFLFWQVIGILPFMGAIFMKFMKDGDIGAMAHLDQSSMMKVLESNTTFFLILLSFAIGLIGLFLVIKYLHKFTMTTITTSRSKIDWKRVVFAFIFWGILSSLIVVIGYYTTPEDYVVNFNLKPFLILCVISILFVPLQTSFEEYLFRGYLMQGIGILVKNKWFPLLLTSIVFGGMHFWNPEVEKIGNIIMVYYIGTGLFLGIMTLMDEGLELALGFHAANNLFTALLVTADWTAFQTHSILRDTSEPSVGVDILVPVLVLYPILLFVFSKKYGWSNWKEKLFGKIEEVVDIDELNELGK